MLSCCNKEREVSSFKSNQEDMRDQRVHQCQEIGCIAIMFFFELLFSYDSSQFPSMFSLLTHSQSFFSLSADYLRHSRRRRSQISILLIQEQSKNHFTT